MKKYFLLAVILLIVWASWPKPKAQWSGQLAPGEPVQTLKGLPSPWTKGKYVFTPRARYHIRAVVLSKKHYWANDEEDMLAPYDLALGWGPMSEAGVINALTLSQDGRWYQYSWKSQPPVNEGEIARHSANTHIIAADKNVLRQIKAIRRFDVVTLEGFLVDVFKSEGKREWRWRTSLTRDDSRGGSCEVFWVEAVR